MVTPQEIEKTIAAIRDQSSFIQLFLRDTLRWEIPETIEMFEQISYGWTAEDLRTSDLNQHLLEGTVRQIQKMDGSQPWGIFLLEFNSADVFITGRGMTTPLRKALRGLVPSKRKKSNLPSWKPEHLLFLCTDSQYQHYRFAYFKAPEDKMRQAPMVSFGWDPGTPCRTACEFNLPHLAWPEKPDPQHWVDEWSKAFDVEKVTKRFYEEYAGVFNGLQEEVKGINDPEDRKMFTQVLLNRLMFLRFIERKGWLEFDRRKDYLKALYTAGPLKKETFYRSRLRPLFFQGLAMEKHSAKEIIGKVPFLNGGLFEENNLDQKVKDIGDTAFGPIIGNDGLFYRYNFTVEESTPLDIEVAVDPEMLGKVFEELITGRHESGSYYTPRPIVHFMCHEGLKSYLGTKTDAGTESIAALVDESEVKGLTESHGKQILEALDSFKAVDPACGSGAYLLGLLHEVVNLYRLLYSEKLVKDASSLYDLKLRIICHNLYGVDIDPLAVNIAMLRLWLSLAVEAEEPLPLPNLDFKIECGDALLGSGEWIADNFTVAALQLRATAMVSLKDKYLMAHGQEKATLKAALEKEEKEISFELRALRGEGVIDWRIQFAEVFAKKAGFDIVLANPPYVRHELIKSIKPKLEILYPKVYMGTADLYCYFYARALQILNADGTLVFISSNKWFRGAYGTKLRQYIADTCRVLSITDFGELPVFLSAATFPMIFIAKKDRSSGSPVYSQVKSLDPPYPNILELIRKEGKLLPENSLNGKDWRLMDSSTAQRLKKMETMGISLEEYVRGQMFYGIKTGCNEAFVINEQKRTEIIDEDHNSENIIKPLLVGDDVRRWRIEPNDLWLIYIPWNLDIEEYPSIKKHLYKWKAKLLARPECKEGRYNWWCLARYASDYVDTFIKPKIVFPDIAKDARFAFDNKGMYVCNTTYFLPVDDFYLLGVLNSLHIWNYCKETLTVLGDANKGGRLRFFIQFVKNIPIPQTSLETKQLIANLTKKCLKANGKGCEAWEKEIDDRVAGLYGL